MSRNACVSQASVSVVLGLERQVEEHLTGHLDALPNGDERTRAVVAAMRADEAKHGGTARSMGAPDMPEPLKLAMRLASKVMTTVAYRV